MTKRINMNNGAFAQGGLGVGILSSAGNPWTVADGLADDLVNRGLATYSDPQPRGLIPVLLDPFTGQQFAGGASVLGGGNFYPYGLRFSIAYDAGIAASNWVVLDLLSQVVMAAGGGTIVLPSACIPINAALIPRSGVKWQGVAPAFIYAPLNTTVPDPYSLPTSGTVLIGDALMDGATGAVIRAGTFDGYAANNVDLAQPPMLPAFANAGFTSVGMMDVVFFQFRSAINIGAKNNPGVWYSQFRVHAINCTSWAFRLDNFQNLDAVYMHSSGCVHGQHYGNSSAVLNCGNSVFQHIYNQPRFNYTTKDRGIVFDGTFGDELNELVILRVQTNSNGARQGKTSQQVTNAATLGNGAANVLNIADGSLFEQGMPVWLSFSNTKDFRAYRYGVNQGRVFWVASVAGNTVTLANKLSDALAQTNLVTFVSGTAGELYLNSLGYAGLEFNRKGAGRTTNIVINQIDLEQDSTVGIQAEGLTGAHLRIFNMPPVSATIPPALPQCHIALAARDSQFEVGSHARINYDVDGASRITLHGLRLDYTDDAAGIGNAPYGMYESNVWLTGKFNDATPDFSGAGGDGLRFGGGINRQTLRLAASGNAIDGINILTGAAAGQTLTLSAPTTNSLGGECEVVNMSTQPWSIVIQGGRLFNGKAGLATIVMNANSSATFRKTSPDGVVFGYAIAGCTASYAAGVISGV